MKILVLGASGMAGHVIAIRLQEKGHIVTGLARKQLPFCKTIVADAKDVKTLEYAINTNAFDAVINCIGVLNSDVDENPEDGIWLNSYLPHLLVKLVEQSKTRVIHISTDCVFSGYENGDYKEDSFRSADTFYGRSKALGEIIDNKNLTFRTSIVGPDINENGQGLFNWFMKQKNDINGYTRAIWTGVTTIVLADAIDAALKQNLTGLYHLVNGEKISKYNLLKLFNNLRRYPITINHNSQVCANKSLINTRHDFDFTVPTYENMVSDMGKWITMHGENLYMKYLDNL